VLASKSMRWVENSKSWTGALIGALLCSAALARAGDAARMPDIVLITLDTTRADRIGVYGYSGETTPNLDRFAERALVYSRAYSTATWTYPAHVSLFTGKFPTSHGARYDAAGTLLLTNVVPGPPRLKQYRVRGLAPGERTLARILSEAGYRTGAVVAGPWLKRIMGLHDGFDSYDDENIRSMNGRIAPEVTDRGLAWIRANSDRPFFLFLNYFDPHGPRKAPEGFERELPSDVPGPPRSDSSRAYDAEVRFMDHHIGRLFDGLRALGRYDDTWIVVTSDHGELLGEHGRTGHGNALDEVLVRIPLIVKSPDADAPTGRSDMPAQQLDVFATILDRLGIEPPRGIQGQPLGRVSHPVIAELVQLDFMKGAARRSGGTWRGHQKAYYDGRYKFVWSSLGRHQLFDVFADPYELEDRIEVEREVAAMMQRRLEEYLATLPEPASEIREIRTVDPETEEALRELGYLE
jgi:arylsulfatase A-like enzyme